MASEYHYEDEDEDEVRSEVEEIAKRTNGGEITSRNVFDLVLAVDHAAYKRHRSTVRRVNVLTKTVETHIAESTVRDAQILEIQAQQRTCPPIVKAAIEAEHAARHGEHMNVYHKPRRATDDINENHNDERELTTTVAKLDRKVWVMWGGLIFVGNLMANGMLVWLLDKLTKK